MHAVLLLEPVAGEPLLGFIAFDSQSPFVSSVPQIIATVRATKKCGNANLFALVSTLGVHVSPASV